MLDLTKCEKYLFEILKFSRDYNLNPHLVLAIIYKESNCELMSYRYEPKCSYFVNPGHYYKKLGISPETEINMQKTSFGLMQVMGFKAREMGYNGHLPEILVDSELSIKIGCMALDNFRKFWSFEPDYISAYNAGSPRLVAGKYSNQKYVDDVKTNWAFLEKNVKF